MYTAAIVCLSDKGYAGEREDISTGVIEKILLENKGKSINIEILRKGKLLNKELLVY